MPYRCPVCDAEQADGVHLANHLAVTASLGRADHVEWLEEYAPDWADRSPEELADTVVEFAEEVETDADDAGGSAPSVEAGLAEQSRRPGRGELTGEAESVLEEARELTRRMYEEGDESGSSPDETANADAGGGDRATGSSSDGKPTGDENE